MSPLPPTRCAPRRRWVEPLAVVALALAALGSGQGCINVTVAETRRGNPIDGDKVRKLTKGTHTLADVLSTLGAPIEVHAHPDGVLLVYRYAARNTFRIGLEAGGGVMSFIDFTRVLSSLLENLRFTLERVHADEDRVVVLIGRDGRVKGIGYRDRTGDLPFF